MGRRKPLYELNAKYFDWDTKKNTININKHGISFIEAASVFSDEAAKYYDDDIHSLDEERYVVIGKSRRLNILIVCHCYKDSNSVVRLISARKADEDEIAMYEEEDLYE